MQDATKTPFEIRLELLQMARDYLDKIQDANLQFAQTAFYKLMESNENIALKWKDYVPATYSFEDIVAKATDLQRFVDGRKAPTK